METTAETSVELGKPELQLQIAGSSVLKILRIRTPGGSTHRGAPAVSEIYL